MRGALGWYRPSVGLRVGVPRDVSCRALVVSAATPFQLTDDSSVHTVNLKRTKYSPGYHPPSAPSGL